MKNTNTSPAQKQYEERFDSALTQLALLKQKIQEHKKRTKDTTIHYGHVGDLGYVNESLETILTFLK
jgi:hypothetical protein